MKCSFDVHCMRREYGKERSWSQTLESWRTETRQKSMLGDSMQRKVLRQKMVRALHSQLQMEQSKCLEEIMESETFCGINPKEAKNSKMIFEENPTGLIRQTQ